jgi:putative zinc finger/helix-turn-helix YgiT family protein
MKSSITGKEMTLRRETRTLTFRKEEFRVLYHYYLCTDSGEQFTSTELDEINLNQLYNEYRQKYNLPFPDEIKSIREKYGLSAVKMSESLGFGVNIYRNYENGEVPNESNGKLIKLAQEPKRFRDIVELSGTLLPDKKKQILGTIDDIIMNEEHRHCFVGLEEYFLGSHLPDEFSGYKKPNLEKLTEMVVFFTEKVQPWKTKLNKLLFYADFCFFKQTCFSISGTRYRAIDLGPVPNNFDTIFDYAETNNLIQRQRQEFDNGGWGETFLPNSNRKFNRALFLELELQILNNIVDRFGTMSATEISNISHREKAWKENFEQGKRLISYKYSFELEAV